MSDVYEQGWKDGQHAVMVALRAFIAAYERDEVPADDPIAWPEEATSGMDNPF